MVKLGRNALERPFIPDQFIRIEDKYVVPVSYEQSLKDLIASHLKPSYIDGGARFTLIESVYFDSDRLDFFRDHFSQAETRHKLRIRQYAPNGVWSEGLAYIEAKTKTRGISSKERLSLDPGSHSIILTGGLMRVTAALRRKNPALSSKKIQDRVSAINALIEKHRVRPHLAIQYKRFAFEEKNLRVTLDREVMFRTLSRIKSLTALEIKGLPLWTKANAYAHKFSSDRALIVEVKHLNGRPPWLEDFMASIGLKCTGFSKYCWGVSNHIEKVSGPGFQNHKEFIYASLDH
jgi:SPX domain protein involved in polyphosphate accumulation